MAGLMTAEEDELAARKQLEAAKASSQAYGKLRPDPDQTRTQPLRRPGDVRRTPPLGVPNVQIDDASTATMGPEELLRRARTTAQEIRNTQVEIDRSLAPVREMLTEIRDVQKLDAKSWDAFGRELGVWRERVDTQMKTISLGPDTQLKSVMGTVEKMENGQTWQRRYIAGFICAAIGAGFVFGGWVRDVRASQDEQREANRTTREHIGVLVKRTDEMASLIATQLVSLEKVDEQIRLMQASIVTLQVQQKKRKDK